MAENRGVSTLIPCEDTDTSYDPLLCDGKSGDHNFVYNEDLTQSETKADVKLSWKREYYDEIIATLNLAWPLIISMMSQVYMQPVATIFGGRLSTEEMDAVALANTIINVFGNSIITGMSSACDTIFTQTYGSTRRTNLGVCFQKSIIIHLLCLLPCYALQLNIRPLLLVMGQDADVARMVDTYLLYFTPGLVSIVRPNIIFGIIGIVVHVIGQYIMLFKLNLGIQGSAIAQTIGYFVMFSLTLLYILVSGVYKSTWKGWNPNCLAEWKTFVKLGLFGILMVCLEWWAIEGTVIIAGISGTVELATQSVLFNLEVLIFPIGYGFATASCIRLGHSLGAGHPNKAVVVSRVGLALTAIIALLSAVLFAVLRQYLPMIFTDIPEVLEMTTNTLPVFVVYLFFDIIACMGRGLMRSTGKHALGSVFTFVGFYVFSLPIGISCMFLTDLGVAGLWLGLLVGILVCDITYCAYMFCCNNWDILSEQAQERVGAKASRGPQTVKKEVTERSRLLDNSPNEDDTDHFYTDNELHQTVTKKEILQKVLIIFSFIGIMLIGLACRFILEGTVYDESSSPNNITLTSSSYYEQTSVLI